MNVLTNAVLSLLLLGINALAGELDTNIAPFGSSAAEVRPQVAGRPASHPVRMNLTRQEWLQDLDALDSLIRNAHVNPFWHNNEAGYMGRFYQAQTYIRQARRIDPAVVNGHLEKLLAYIADGHSYLVDKAGRFGLYPFQVEWFGNDLFISAATEDCRHLLGARIIAIDDTPIARANALILPFVPVVNASSYKLQSRDVFRLAGLLHVAGVSRHPERMTLTVQLHGGRKVRQLYQRQGRPPAALLKLSESNGIAIPLYRQRRASDQWLALIGDALYVRYAAVVEKQPGDIARLSRQISELIGTGTIRKVIVDVRDNEGGDSYHNAALVEALRRADQLNQRGKLFVLTNHNSFSAAVNFAGNMEARTRAVFIGEQMGDRASFAGESGPQALYQLPHSHIGLSLSFSEWSPTYHNDRREAVHLDLPVSTSVADVLAGRDPVLQAALDYPAVAAPIQTSERAAFAPWLGRYDYSPDKALKLFEADGSLQMEITESVFSRLTLGADGMAVPELAGIRLRRLPGGAIEWRQDGSPDRVLVRLPDNQLKPLELLMDGRFSEARAAYRAVYDATPALLSIRANSLGMLASQLRERYRSQRLYRELRAIAVHLHGNSLLSWDDEGDHHAE